MIPGATGCDWKAILLGVTDFGTGIFARGATGGPLGWNWKVYVVDLPEPVAQGFDIPYTTIFSIWRNFPKVIFKIFPKILASFSENRRKLMHFPSSERENEKIACGALIFSISL